MSDAIVYGSKTKQKDTNFSLDRNKNGVLLCYEYDGGTSLRWARATAVFMAFSKPDPPTSSSKGSWEAMTQQGNSRLA